jgi:hypothetical protein
MCIPKKAIIRIPIKDRIRKASKPLAFTYGVLRYWEAKNIRRVKAMRMLKRVKRETISKRIDNS